MFQGLISIAAAIYIWRAIQQWRATRRTQRSLEPGAGLTFGIKPVRPRWVTFSGALVLSFVAISITILFVQSHEQKEQAARIAAQHEQCIDAHTDKSKPFDPDVYLVALSAC